MRPYGAQQRSYAFRFAVARTFTGVRRVVDGEEEMAWRVDQEEGRGVGCGLPHEREEAGERDRDSTPVRKHLIRKT